MTQYLKYLALGIVLSCVNAQADDGAYSENALIRHFGRPTLTLIDFGSGKELAFAKDGWEINAELYHDQACFLVFSLKEQHEFDERRQLSILQDLFPGLTWKPVRTDSVPGPSYIHWNSSSAWKGFYSNGLLSISNPEMEDEYNKASRAYLAGHQQEFTKEMRQFLLKPTP